MTTPGAGAGRRSRALPAEVGATGELIEKLNLGWRLSGPPPAHASLKQRLLYPLRRLMARLLGPQETFNSTLVQYVNATSGARQVMVEAALEQMDEAVEEVRRVREALAARERRMEAAMAALHGEHGELRTAVGVLQQQVRTARATSPAPAPALAAAPGPAAVQPAAGAAAAPDTGHALSDKYVGFEDQFRGSAADIRARLAEYLPIFAGASDVLDVGCGRGEFLDLLREHRVSARGIDLNAAMVQVSRDKGLDVTCADALPYLRAQPPGSLGGLFAAQVVEHLEPGYLTRFLDAAFDALRPGAPIVLETINPACWFAFFQSYIRDITHVRPLHPDTLRFLLVATGFQQVEVQYRAPYPEHEKLQPLAATGALRDAAETLNANVEKLNGLLFTYLDYAAVARKP